MKKLCVLIGCLGILVSFALSSEEEAYSSSYARLSYVKGDVFVERTEDLGYEEGVVNLPLVEGDKLGTKEGRAEIHFGRKNYLRLDSYTHVDFVQLPKRGDDSTKLHLLSGCVFLRVSYLDEEIRFEIHTPDASFYVAEEGLYRFDVRENRETELFVYQGTIEAAGEEGSLLVESEEKLVVSNGYFTTDPENFYGRLDDSFSQWNEERDDLHFRAVSQSYLPSELDEYENELADNGSWVYERPYGYVWVPYVVHHEWVPYYYGRWRWYPFIGWTWVSYEPWGWCTYHYGRWHWRLGLGWYWIPARVWGPAWVHWCWGYDYIGWCPLSYYGRPVVVINNYFYGRYSGRTYPNNSRALVVIRKDQLQAPRISRAALRGDEARRIGKLSLSEGQPSGRPRISKSSLQNTTAARVLSRTNLRSVKKSYASDKALSVSRLKSARSSNSSRAVRRDASSVKREGLREMPAGVSRIKNYSRSSSRASSKSSLQRSETTPRNSSGVSRSLRSESDTRTYPSRLSRTASGSQRPEASPRSSSGVSRSLRSESGTRTYPSRLSRSGSSSKAAASSQEKRSLSSRKSKARAERSASSRSSSSRSNTDSRSRIKRYSSSFPSLPSALKRSSSPRTGSSSASRRSSRSSPSIPSLSRRNAGSRSAVARSSRYSGSRPTISRRSSTSRPSVSSRSSSRSVSSRRSSGSSARVSSSSRGRSSSSARVSRSSGRSSSSRSSSGRSVRRK